MNYYPHNIGDYRAATIHLSLVEHGAYRQLLDTYYLNEEPLPTDTDLVCRRLMARSEEEREAVRAVLAEFFDLTDAGWVHSRCEEEIAKYHGIRESARKGARARWAKASDGAAAMPEHSGGNADAMPTHQIGNAKQETRNKNQEPRTKRPVVATEDDGFGRFWSAYPKKVAKPDAMRAWKKVGPDEQLLATMLSALEEHKRGRNWTKDDGAFIPNPATWLNNHRWEDMLVATADGDNDPFAGVL